MLYCMSALLLQCYGNVRLPLAIVCFEWLNTHSIDT